MMNQLISAFPRHLEEALLIGEKLPSQSGREIRNVVVTGLGGSGIGGTIAGEILASELKVPYQVNKDYFLPASVDHHTLVIVSSYSGGTEETLAAFKTALEKGAAIACITSGGILAEQAKALNLPSITIPSGMPPRACLGYSLPQIFFILHRFGLISDAFMSWFRNSIQHLDLRKDNIKEGAYALAVCLFDKIPVIYAAAGYEGVAIRFRQQLNENAKILCWHHVLPEMNHNELVGWTQKDERLAAIFLRNEDDYFRTVKRMEITHEIVSKYAGSVTDITSQGESRLERTLFLIHMLDWVSYYLAEKRNVDAVEVNIINHLKDSLASI
jgi:glucose/mannose-6-phosphate isomerase